MFTHKPIVSGHIATFCDVFFICLTISINMNQRCQYIMFKPILPSLHVLKYGSFIRNHYNYRTDSPHFFVTFPKKTLTGTPMSSMPENKMLEVSVYTVRR